jgi:membrane associated rhomboid family serine protease
MRATWEDPPEYRGGGGGLALPSMTPVVRWLLISNGALFLLFAFLVNYAVPPGRLLFDVLALAPEQWRDFFPLVPLWQVLTYGFLHDPHSALHVFYNLLGLYFFGTLLEGVIGSRRLLWIYLAALILGALVQLGVSFATGALLPTVGASGGVLCVILAAAVLRPDTRVIFIFVPMTLRTLAILMVALDVLPILMRSGGGTAHWVHIAGAAWGFLAARKRWVWLDPLEVLASRRERSSRAAAEKDAERLDRLLRQISENGLHSLSRRDRRFLKRVSERR